MKPLRPRTFDISSGQFNRLVITLLALGFAALVAAVVAATWVVSRSQDHSRWIEHTYDVERAVARYRVQFEQGEAARRGYILTRNEETRRRYEETARILPVAIDTVANLTRDNPSQQRRIAWLRRVNAAQLASLAETTRLLQGNDIRTALVQIRAPASRETVLSIRRITDQMTAEENRLLHIRTERQRDNVRLFYTILAITGVLLVAVAIGSLWLILRYTRDLNRSQAELRLLNNDLEGEVRRRTGDLRRANEEIQRFAYIVSHDLRSPLVNVMGFTAELDAAAKSLDELINRAEETAPDIVTPEARMAAKEDLPEAIGFIRSSTQKMDRLINAILQLSRQGRRLLSPETVDMVAVVSGIRDSLKHRTDESDTTIVIEKPLPNIVTDRLAVEQIFSNLIENAVKYLKPGRPGVITIRGRQQDGRLLYEVEDNGRGIDPRDHDRVFDLFRRSGVQDQPGEGIGLAHVRALDYRLGGMIDCISELDHGATFRVSLPAVYNPATSNMSEGAIA